MPSIEGALQIAAQIADMRPPIVEDAGPNKDRRGWIARFLEACGITFPAPWCAAFVTYCLIQAGWTRAQLPPNPAGCCSWWKWAKSKNILGWVWEDARRGDIFLWCVNGTGHMGWIVETRRVLGVWFIRSIEGNTADNGSREGTRLLRRGIQGDKGIGAWRRVTGKMRYVRGSGLERIA